MPEKFESQSEEAPEVKETEPILERDVTPEDGIEALKKMLRRIKLGKKHIAKDPLSDQEIEELEELIKILPTQREQDIIRRSVIKGELDGLIGKDFGIRVARVGQIRNEAMRKLEEIVETSSKGDAVSDKEKEAFTEMLCQVELGNNNISDDPQLAIELEKMIESLPTKQERNVIKKMFYEGKTIDETAKDLKIKHGKVVELKLRALSRLRRPERTKNIEDIEL